MAPFLTAVSTSKLAGRRFKGRSYDAYQAAQSQHWIAKYTTGIDAANFDRENGLIHISEGNTTSPKVVTLNMDGSIVSSSSKAWTYGSTSYEEFNNPNHFHDGTMYIATAQNTVGTAKSTYPFGNTTAYRSTSTTGNSGGLFYPVGDCEVAISSPGNDDEFLHTCFGSAGSGANTNEVYYSLRRSDSTTNMNVYKIAYINYSRNYPYGLAGNYYRDRVAIVSGLANNSGPYPPCFSVLRHDLADASTTPTLLSVGSGKRGSGDMSNGNLMGWPNAVWWVHFVRNPSTNAHALLLWDNGANCKDQIAFDTTKAEYVGIIYNHDRLTEGVSTNNRDHIVMLKDAVTANRFYLVNWTPDYNNNSTDGGSNSSGAWNTNGDAVQIDFTDGSTYIAGNGKGKGYVDTHDFILGVDIASGYNGVVLKLPRDLDRITAGTYSNFTISRGSSVNTAVNAIPSSSKQVNFSTQQVSASSWATGVTNSSMTISSNSWISESYNTKAPASGVANGQVIFASNYGGTGSRTHGTFTWTPPAGVTSVSVVAVGGGGGGSISSDTYASSGGGLGYKNNISVTPGTPITLQVGHGGYLNGFSAYATPTDTWFETSTTVKGEGGNNNGSGGGYVGDGGGTGGMGGPKSGTYYGGGGGAGGYSGGGGRGGFGGSSWSGTLGSQDSRAGLAGSGGGGGGGHAGGGNGGTAQRGAGGGGVGIFGEGTSGAGSFTYGSQGGEGSPAGTGYGAGALQSNGTNRYAGGHGALRIIWPGADRSYPSTRTTDE